MCLTMQSHSTTHIMRVGCDWCISILPLFHSSREQLFPQWFAIVPFSCYCAFWSWASMLQEFQFDQPCSCYQPGEVLSGQPTCVPVRILNNKLTSFQIGQWLVSWACSEMAEVWVGVSYISLSCSLILSCIGLRVSPMQTLPHLQGILQTTQPCLAGLMVSFGCTSKLDQSVMSDLKTVQMSCCFRQPWRGSDFPWT